MYSPQTGFPMPHPKMINFSYISPKHVSTILFTAKHNTQRLKFPQDIENPLKSSHLDYSLSTNNCCDNELDTTLDSLNEVPNPDHTIHRHRKPLAHSVIVSQNISDQVFNELDFCNRLTEAGGKNEQFNSMKRSCMPGSFSQSQFAERCRLPIVGKENTSFLKYPAKEKNLQPFCFSKQKLIFKKPSSKLSNAKIEDFEIGVMLGKGSIGRVYLVRHFKTNFYFALKKITKSEVKDINQFILGVKCHFFMNSPHIVQLYACFSDSESIYLLMELCVDGNLAKEKKIMRHDEERNRVLLGIAKGVQSMHRNFIRHGDLKLENIMVSFGFAKLTDLDCVCIGSSSTFQEQRKKNELWGSPAYFSPDMIKNCTFSLSDDIWAVGVITYELFTHSQPFSLIGSDDLYKVVEKEMSPLPPNLKDKTKSIISQILHKDERERASLEEIIEYCQSSLEKKSPHK